MKIVGKTVDERPVVSGLFKMLDTMGVPLTDILEKIDSYGFQIAWDCFYKDAIKAGWKQKTIDKKIREAILDCYGKQYYDQWVEKYSDYLVVEGAAADVKRSST